MRNNNSQNGQYSKDDIYALLVKSDMAVVRGVEAIYARQTADEKSAETTSHSNGVGFTGVDAGILSSFAKQIAKWRAEKVETGSNRYPFPLSPKQMVIARKKMFKYSAQLAGVANAKAGAANGQAPVADGETALVVAIVKQRAEDAAELAAERAAIQAVEVDFDEFETVEIEDEYLTLA
jgi:hypothetical protein